MSTEIDHDAIARAIADIKWHGAISSAVHREHMSCVEYMTAAALDMDPEQALPVLTVARAICQLEHRR